MQKRKRAQSWQQLTPLIIKQQEWAQQTRSEIEHSVLRGVEAARAAQRYWAVDEAAVPAASSGWGLSLAVGGELEACSGDTLSFAACDATTTTVRVVNSEWSTCKSEVTTVQLPGARVRPQGRSTEQAPPIHAARWMPEPVVGA